jgi:threonine dehydrogenase-like Zn-dependent dehydrogenase
MRGAGHEATSVLEDRIVATVLKVGSPGQVRFAQIDAERELRPGEIRIQGLISAISHGTELNHVRGTSPFADRHFDPNLRAFVQGTAAGAHSPDRLGYEMVGKVMEVGPRVDGIHAGDLVHTGTPHQDTTIVNITEQREFGYPLTVLPGGAHLEPGLFISLGSVALQAIHDARIRAGDRVLVSGLGVIGLLTVQLAALSGASAVVAADPLDRRRQLAGELGATLTLEPREAEKEGGVALRIKRAYGAAGVDIAIETSGSYAALHSAIASVGVGGRVVSVGFYQGDGVGLRLGEEWHHNRPDLISSMGVWGCPHRDYPLWDRQRLTDQVRDLLYSGKLATDSLLTHRLPFGRAQEAYTLIDTHPQDVLKVALVYEEYDQYARSAPGSRPS